MKRNFIRIEYTILFTVVNKNFKKIVLNYGKLVPDLSFSKVDLKINKLSTCVVISTEQKYELIDAPAFQSE